MKTPSTDGFNKVAFAYDALARIFIGKSIQQAQRYFLQEVKQAGQILILGGGTGWILQDIAAVNPRAKIYYVEASSIMIDKAKRVSSNNHITFIHGTGIDIPGEIFFDVVITNFYFDLFPKESLKKRVDLIASRLLPKAMLLATDFVITKNISHRILLWIMYRFFRMVTRMEARSLPPWEKIVADNGFQVRKSQVFKNGFIKSIVFDSQNTK
jgi:hypothetical protein